MPGSIGSVSVTVVPDARGFPEKLKAELARIQDDVRVKVDADTAEASAQLEEVQLQADHLDGRNVRVKVDVDRHSLSNIASSLDGMLGQLGMIPALALTAGSALIPLAAAAAGVGAALAAPLAIGGGGLGLFALFGGLAAKDTEKQLKNIDTLRQHLGTLTKGTAEYAAAQKQLHDAEAALTPQQKAFAAAQDSLTGAFQKFLAGPGGKSLLDVMAQGMTVLAHTLPLVAPVMVSVGGALSTLLGDVDKAAQSKGFSHFVDQFARLAGRDIRIGGHILEDLAKGIGSLLLATDKGFSGSFLHGLHQMSQSFADWASSKAARHDLREFFDYVHRVGPGVGDAIAAVARALGHIVKALAPLGPPVLHVIAGIADAISGIPVPVLTALATAAGGLVAFQKVGGFKALGAISGGSFGSGLGGGVVAKALGRGVVPVFVTNPGFGGAGAGGTLGTAEKDASRLGPLKYVPQAALVGVAGYEGYKGVRLGIHDIGNAITSAIRSSAAPTSGSSMPGPHSTYAVRYPGLNYFDPKPIKATGTAVDALRANLGKASAQMDLVGRSGARNFGAVGQDVDALKAKLASIHDKQVQVILRDEDAVRRLEALQAWRIHDKAFRVTEYDRVVGPGGGIGHPGGNSDQIGMGSGGGAGVPRHHFVAPSTRGLPAHPRSGSGGGASSGMTRTPVALHVGDQVFGAYLDERYVANADADRRYARQMAGG